MTKKDRLQIIKDLYEEEGKRGDLAEAARLAKVSNPISSSAMERNTWKELTDAERKAVLCLHRILNNRVKEDLEMVNEQNL